MCGFCQKKIEREQKKVRHACDSGPSSDGADPVNTGETGSSVAGQSLSSGTVGVIAR